MVWYSATTGARRSVYLHSDIVWQKFANYTICIALTVAGLLDG